MSLLDEYEFESLPYMDSEYDNPMVSSLVHSMISDEMKTFVPNEKNYLAHLPYPSLKFSNFPTLQSEFSRVVRSGGLKSLERLDMKRYQVDEPTEGPLQKDIQAWRKSVSNAKTQYEHQQTKLLNVEVVSESMKDFWLTYNKHLESLDKGLHETISKKKRKIAEINTIRKIAQDKAGQELNRFMKRRDNAIMKQNQILIACDNIIFTQPENVRSDLLRFIMEAHEEDGNGNTDNELY